jgi:hypothetical protein
MGIDSGFARVFAAEAGSMTHRSHYMKHSKIVHFLASRHFKSVE